MWGGLLGNKRPDRGKKNFRGGQKFSGGTFWGNAKKGLEKLFGGSKKWWEFFWGSQQFFGGEFFRKKKKSPGGFSGKFLNFRGDFLGGSYTGGRVWGECWEIKDKIGEKNFRGPEILGGTFGGNAKKGVEKLFWGKCWGSCEPQQILGGNFWKNVKEKNLGGNFGG